MISQQTTRPDQSEIVSITRIADISAGGRAPAFARPRTEFANAFSPSFSALAWPAGCRSCRAASTAAVPEKPRRAAGLLGPGVGYFSQICSFQ
jgi:hypothetical protein